jgi:hypothetical protein
MVDILKSEKLTSFVLQLYAESMARFQGGSPYIYPLYGLGELPQVCIVICLFHQFNFNSMIALSIVFMVEDNLLVFPICAGICST